MNRVEGSPIPVLVLAGAGAAIVAHLALTSPPGDYMSSAPVAGDNAGPAIDSLMHGHLASFVSNQPLMGLTSLALRVPFAGLAALLGGGNLLVYRIGALACALPAVLLATWLIVQREGVKERRLAGVLAAIVVLAGPVVADAVHVGHPEEVLAAVLATGAVLAAMRGRSIWAGAMLGLAIGTKQWALLAAAPVLLTLSHRRVAMAAIAGALAVALTATLPIGDPAAFGRASTAVGAGHLIDPFSLWWPFGSALATPAHGSFVPSGYILPFGLDRSAASAVGLLAALGVLTLYWTCLGGRRRQVDALALLALAGLVRCVADPLPIEYNFVCLLIPLAVWEVVSLARLPVATALTTAAVALIAGGGMHASPATLSALSIAWTLPLACYLARQAFVPGALALPAALRLFAPRPTSEPA